MAFVHGHPRDVGWVKAHRRPPNRAEDGQLPLIAEVLDDDREATEVESEDAAAVGRIAPDVTGPVD